MSAWMWGPCRGRRYPGDGWRPGGYLAWWSVDPVVLHQLSYDALPAVRREARPESADAVGAMLVTENLASIHYRYPDTREGGAIPGPHHAYWDTPYAFAYVRPVPTPIEALKLVACYEYQSCEHPAWPASEAYSFCDALRRQLVGVLDGYGAAPWGWPPEPER